VYTEADLRNTASGSIHFVTEPATEAVARSALDACLEGALDLRELTVLASRRGPSDDGHEALLAPRRSQPRGGDLRGFDVNAGVPKRALSRRLSRFVVSRV
jgi:hypothetical protein